MSNPKKKKEKRNQNTKEQTKRKKTKEQMKKKSEGYEVETPVWRRFCTKVNGRSLVLTALYLAFWATWFRLKPCVLFLSSKVSSSFMSFCLVFSCSLNVVLVFFGSEFLLELLLC